MKSRTSPIVVLLVLVGAWFWINNFGRAAAEKVAARQAVAITSDVEQLIQDSSHIPITPEGRRLKPFLVTYVKEAEGLYRAYDALDADHMFSDQVFGTKAGRAQSRRQIAQLATPLDRLEEACGNLSREVDQVFPTREAKTLKSMFDQAITGLRRAHEILNSIFDLADSKNVTVNKTGELVLDEETASRLAELTDELQALEVKIQKLAGG